MIASQRMIRLAIMLILLPALSSHGMSSQTKTMRLTAVKRPVSDIYPQLIHHEVCLLADERISQYLWKNADWQNSDPQIRMVTPTMPVAYWSLHDRVGWAALLILVALGYWILVVQHRILRRMDECSQLLQEAVHAVGDGAHAAQNATRALSYQTRPWMTVSIELMDDAERSFRIVATNRGQCPAEIISLADRVGVVRSESFLPAVPEFTKEATPMPPETVVYPNQSIMLQKFKYDDLRWICSTQELFNSVQRGIDKVFVYGKILYRETAYDLSPNPYETNWCYCYAQRGSKGMLLPFGPIGYRQCK